MNTTPRVTQPLIVFKTKGGREMETKLFRSTSKAAKWLRTEGCHFSNNVFSNLDDASIILMTEEFEYEVQAATFRQCERIPRRGGRI